MLKFSIVWEGPNHGARGFERDHGRGPLGSAYAARPGRDASCREVWGGGGRRCHALRA